MTPQAAFLYLENGEIFRGLAQKSFSPRAGEVVFNTSHSGYEEVATDPSYMNQIIVMTSPMQGNYGVDDRVWESGRVWIEAFISLKNHKSPRTPSWSSRLDSLSIPSVTDLDTRKLTLRLRELGTIWGALVSTGPDQLNEQEIALAKNAIAVKKQADGDWVYASSRQLMEKRAGLAQNKLRIVVVDLGCKENILREIQKLAGEVVIVPSRTSAAEILALNAHGLVLTNGPGDPAAVQVTTNVTRSLIGKLPIFGICMGHQILGLALGGQTYKLKFGHRGSNHPIRDDLLNRVYISSQNHGYAVDPKTLPPSVRVTQTNLNDMTCAGFYSAQEKILGIQYHPESRPGPHDAENLFQFFMDRMVKTK